MPLGRLTDNKPKFLDIPEDPEGEKLVGIPEDSEAEHEDEWVKSTGSMESVIEIEVEGRVAETGCGRSSRTAKESELAGGSPKAPSRCQGSIESVIERSELAGGSPRAPSRCQGSMESAIEIEPPNAESTRYQSKAVQTELTEEEPKQDASGETDIIDYRKFADEF